MEPIDIKKQKGKFFEILQSTDKSQVGVMTIKPGGDSGPENIHPGDQIIYVIEGEADVDVDGKSVKVSEGQVFIVPAKSEHHIYNKSSKDLFFLTLYAPPAY
jgi:mannose-6-phosphate isomerase-like protein (cupin superfamily)